MFWKLSVPRLRLAATVGKVGAWQTVAIGKRRFSRHGATEEIVSEATVRLQLRLLWLD